mmetsp:Transcript_18019/g.38460  ORF Transcript_18019/g.38460 Transcript_18019/m.38460 type:complete len:215 (-) Transcript_18019:1411-2055(-)
MHIRPRRLKETPQSSLVAPLLEQPCLEYVVVLAHGTGLCTRAEHIGLHKVWMPQGHGQLGLESDFELVLRLRIRLNNLHCHRRSHPETVVHLAKGAAPHHVHEMHVFEGRSWCLDGGEHGLRILAIFSSCRRCRHRRISIVHAAVPWHRSGPFGRMRSRIALFTVVRLPPQRGLRCQDYEVEAAALLPRVVSPVVPPHQGDLRRVHIERHLRRH